MTLIRQPGAWDAFLNADTGASGAAFYWLGQAGFAFRHQGRLWMIDPYLSDHLAVKYRGKHFPHTRMMPPPVTPERTPPLDAILCSHRHSDHMDPTGLPVLLARSPHACVVAPRAERGHARALGLLEDRVHFVNAGEAVAPVDGLTFHAVPASHETLETDTEGNHRYLGFIFTVGGVTFYHGGDTIPYFGLADTLRQHGVSVAMLPVNGRDAYRRDHGVPGNMTLDEARALCVAADVPNLVPHHFGMFAFNTAEPASLAAAAAASKPPRCWVPDPEHYFITAMETR